MPVRTSAPMVSRTIAVDGRAGYPEAPDMWSRRSAPPSAAPPPYAPERTEDTASCIATECGPGASSRKCLRLEPDDATLGPLERSSPCPKAA